MLSDSHSDMFITIAKPSARQLQLLPAFDADVRDDKGIKRKSIVVLARALDGTNLQQYWNKNFEAKEVVVDDMEG